MVISIVSIALPKARAYTHIVIGKLYALEVWDLSGCINSLKQRMCLTRQDASVVRKLPNAREEGCNDGRVHNDTSVSFEFSCYQGFALRFALRFARDSRGRTKTEGLGQTSRPADVCNIFV